MAITKTISIDGKDVLFRASAAIPRLYRNRFGRDIFQDLRSLSKSVESQNPDASMLDSFSLELFEDIAYIMAKHASPSTVPDSPEDWLDGFQTFSIYQILPQIVELWGLNLKTHIPAKKNSVPRNAR